VEGIRTWVHGRASDPGTAFLWVCFFCNNQVRILEEQSQEGSDDLETTFAARLTSIGRVLVLFDNWRSPVYLSRVWCVFETYMADQAGVSLEIILSESETASLLAELRGGNLGAVTSAWSQIDVEMAQASRALDEKRVKGLIRSRTSFDRVNAVVRDRLLAWFHTQLQGFMQAEVERGGTGRTSTAPTRGADCAGCAALREELSDAREEIEALRRQLKERDEDVARLKSALEAATAMP